MGDLLLVEATEMVVATRGGVHVKSFLDKAKEVLESEVQQEVRGPDRRGDLGACHRLARGKTGPLFAFTAGLAGTGEPHLAHALEEAGYQIGTAYQLANDLLDLTGDENTDARRVAEECVAGLCAGAIEGLASWPHVQAGVAEFLVHDLRPSLARESSPRQATLQDAP
jgi:geranylgeranyl pyrophosphate synthase